MFKIFSAKKSPEEKALLTKIENKNREIKVFKAAKNHTTTLGRCSSELRDPNHWKEFFPLESRELDRLLAQLNLLENQLKKLTINNQKECLNQEI